LPKGFDDDLDELREIARNGKKYIAQIKDKLAKEAGIPSLKIGYNKVFGYYIEVTNTHKEQGARSFHPQTDAGEFRALHHP
jgi:DNA mismatch repair protein MutS